MARETKEERETRQFLAEQARHAALAEYKATIPARLMNAQALASSIGVDTQVSLTPTGPSVRFTKPDNDSWERTGSYEMEEWELEDLEMSLVDIRSEQEARAQRRIIAQEVWGSLSVLQKTSLKEFIHYLH
jgi:hypothetical protein